MSDWPPGMAIRPIVSWPGEFTKHRMWAPFRANWSQTLELLDRELRMMGAQQTVLQVAIPENQFRLDGYPRAQAKQLHPGVILTFNSPHGPLSYPCDSFTDWQDNVRGIALALEALRKVDRYGVSKRGEQYRGWKQLTYRKEPMTSDQARTLVLEWAGDKGDPADMASSIKEARRRAHPDAGGTEEAFKAITEAAGLLNGA
jgi:hypothetical protein